MRRCAGPTARARSRRCGGPPTGDICAFTKASASRGRSTPSASSPPGPPPLRTSSPTTATRSSSTSTTTPAVPRSTTPSRSPSRCAAAGAASPACRRNDRTSAWPRPRRARSAERLGAVTDRAGGLDLAELLGGRRGVVDASTPGVVLVIVDTFAPLGWAIGAAVLAAGVVAVLRLVRHEPLRQAGMGLIGLAGAAVLAAVTGSAKTYFLPGILANAGYAVLTTASIVIGRPLLGYIAAMLDRGYGHWREDPGLHRAATIATAMWATVFTLRALVQGYLYEHDHVHWLAPVRLGMGRPLWARAAAGPLFVLGGRRREVDVPPGKPARR